MVTYVQKHERLTAEDRRQQLIEVSIDLFSKKGFGGTTTKEIAAAALFLASDASSFVVGHILNVDGGFQAAGLMFDPAEDATPWDEPDAELPHRSPAPAELRHGNGIPHATKGQAT